MVFRDEKAETIEVFQKPSSIESTSLAMANCAVAEVTILNGRSAGAFADRSVELMLSSNKRFWSFPLPVVRDGSVTATEVTTSEAGSGSPRSVITSA